jgi:hypothetical protein
VETSLYLWNLFMKYRYDKRPMHTCTRVALLQLGNHNQQPLKTITPTPQFTSTYKYAPFSIMNIFS